MKIIHLKEWVKIEEKDNETIITPLSELEDKAFSIKSQHNHRTVAQNASLHLYCQKVSAALNDGGFSVNMVLNRKRDSITRRAFADAKKWVSVIPKALQAIERLEEIVFEKDLELSWTMLLVKDIIWREIQKALFKGKASTSKLNSDEVTQVYQAMNHYLASRIGIESIDFPSIDSMIFEQNYKNMYLSPI